VTYDFQLYYHGKQFRSELSFFDSKITDSIGFIFPGGVRTFANTGSIDFHGFEWEMKYSFTDSLMVDASITHQHNENDAGLKDRQMEPSTMVKFGINYQFPKGGSISVFNNHYSSPPDWNDFSATTLNLNPNTGSYNHLTFNLTIPGSLLFPGQDWERVEFSLFIDNALESSPVYWPDISRGDLNAWPRYPGRRAYLKAKYKF